MHSTRDASVEALERLFRQHPSWQKASRFISPGAESRVLFTHLAGEEWTLRRTSDACELVPARCEDPDFVLRFAPGAVLALEAARGGVADFAIALFECALSDDPMNRIDLRIVASFTRLIRRGYVELLIAAGPRLLAFGATHEIASLAELRRLVTALRGPTDGE